MSDDERRLEAAAKVIHDWHCPRMVDYGTVHPNDLRIAANIVDAYNAPLEPPELVTKMATAMLDIPGCPWDAVPYARAALRVVVRRMRSRQWLIATIAKALGLPVDEVEGMLADE